MRLWLQQPPREPAGSHQLGWRRDSGGRWMDVRFPEGNSPLVSTVLVKVPKSARFDPAILSQGSGSEKMTLGTCGSDAAGALRLPVTSRCTRRSFFHKRRGRGRPRVPGRLVWAERVLGWAPGGEALEGACGVGAGLTGEALPPLGRGRGFWCEAGTGLGAGRCRTPR